MKKFILMLAAIFSLGYAVPVHAAASGSFNEGSYDKVTTLSAAVEAFAKVSANGELPVLATHMAAIQEKASALSSYDIKAEAPNDSEYAAAAEGMQKAAVQLETVSKKMADAARNDDDVLFVSYKDEYNNSVNSFNDAINTYATATERTVERVKLEQMTIVGATVATGILTIALWFWASSDDAANRARSRLRRRVAIASSFPFIGALLALGLYLFDLINGYMVWLPIALGLLALLTVWVIYLVRRRRLPRLGAA